MKELKILFNHSGTVIVQGTLEDFPKLAPLPVEPEEDEVADDLKVCTNNL